MMVMEGIELTLSDMHTSESEGESSDVYGSDGCIGNNVSDISVSIVFNSVDGVGVGDSSGASCSVNTVIGVIFPDVQSLLQVLQLTQSIKYLYTVND
jgi:hypothetical protein